MDPMPIPNGLKDPASLRVAIASEAEELSKKLIRLSNFLESSMSTHVSNADLTLLLAQQHHMTAYLNVLNRRLERLQPKLPHL